MQQTANTTVSGSTAVKTPRRSFQSTRAAALALKSTHGTERLYWSSEFSKLGELLWFQIPTGLSPCLNRKATFDMFNFLASQHRELPDITGPFEEEDDDFPLKSSRQDRKSAILIQFQPHRRGTNNYLAYITSMLILHFCARL